jgi:hypothetical protein
MIQKKQFPVKVFFVLMLWVLSSITFSAEHVKAASENQIQISNLKISPISSSNCKVEVSFLATYKNFKTGKEPQMWWQIIGGGNSSLGFRPLKVKENIKDIKVSGEELGLAPTSHCSGNMQVFFWLNDGDIKSNEIETVCIFK